MQHRPTTTIRHPIITHRRISGALVSGPHCLISLGDGITQLPRSIAVLLAELSAKEPKMTDLLETAEDGIAWLTLNSPRSAERVLAGDAARLGRGAAALGQ